MIPKFRAWVKDDGDVENGLFDINWSYYIEVIGNVWEDGELLEVTK